MRARRAIFSTLILFLSSSARANYAFQGMVSLSGGYTSNAGATSSGPGSADDPDALILISPSGIVTANQPRAINRISYAFMANLFASHPELTSLSSRLDWTGIFTPSKTTDLMLGLNATQTQLNTIDLQTIDTGNGVPTTITHPGTTTFWGVGA